MAVAPANILTYNQSLSQGPTAAKAAASYIQKNAPAPSGTFNAHTTNAPVSTGGGTSSSASGGGVSSNNQPSYQSAPSAPDTSEIDKAYGDAMSGIDNLIGQFTSALPGQNAAFDTNAATEKTTNSNQLADANATYDTQQAQQKKASDDAVDEQRRMAAEIQQGIQARYGGSTGIGAFASDMSGSQAARSIAQSRNSFAQVLAGIDAGRAQVQRDFVLQNQKIDAQTAQLKQQAQDNLNQQLATLQSTKGQLGINRATSKAQIMQTYQNEVNQINANNTATKNAWAQAQQKFEQDLQLKAMAVQNAAYNSTADFASLFGTDTNGASTAPTGGGSINLNATANSGGLTQAELEQLNSMNLGQ